ncbi:MAG: hypothetical protein ACFFCQ_08600 [Promethearchaeota archaeon]
MSGAEFEIMRLFDRYITDIRSKMKDAIIGFIRSSTPGGMSISRFQMERMLRELGESLIAINQDIMHTIQISSSREIKKIMNESLQAEKQKTQTIETDLQTAKNTIQQFNEQIRDRDSTIQELQSAVSQQETLRKKLQTMMAKAEELLSQLTTQDQRIQAQEEVLKAKEKQLKELNNQLAAARREIQTIQDVYEQKIASMEEQIQLQMLDASLQAEEVNSSVIETPVSSEESDESLQEDSSNSSKESDETPQEDSSNSSEVSDE